MSRALLIVDVQNDFTEGGALAVTGGTAVARAITQHLADTAGEYTVIAASRDWHDPDNDNGGHFATQSPDFVDTWPVHCVAGTAGAEYHPDLDTSSITVQVKKGQGRPSYSAFEGVDDRGDGLAAVLDQAGVDALDVVGIATDHCVRASALDAVKLGFSVTVLAGLTAGVGADSSQTALAELSRAGCVIEGEPLS